MEVAVLKGALRAIHDFAQHVMAERGVRHGRLVAVPVEIEDQVHARGTRAAPAAPPRACKGSVTRRPAYWGPGASIRTLRRGGRRGS
jgi:NikR C terminal nickel binding domain